MDFTVDMNKSFGRDVDLFLWLINHQKHVKFAFSIKNSETTTNYIVRCIRENKKYNEDLGYDSILFKCTREGVHVPSGKEIRRTTSAKTNCPAFIKFRTSSDKKVLKIIEFNTEHNHLPESDSYMEKHLDRMRKNRVDNVDDRKKKLTKKLEAMNMNTKSLDSSKKQMNENSVERAKASISVEHISGITDDQLSTDQSSAPATEHEEVIAEFSLSDVPVVILNDDETYGDLQLLEEALLDAGNDEILQFVVDVKEDTVESAVSQSCGSVPKLSSPSVSQVADSSGIELMKNTDTPLPSQTDVNPLEKSLQALCCDSSDVSLKPSSSPKEAAPRNSSSLANQALTAGSTPCEFLLDDMKSAQKKIFPTPPSSPRNEGRYSSPTVNTYDAVDHPITDFANTPFKVNLEKKECKETTISITCGSSPKEAHDSTSSKLESNAESPQQPEVILTPPSSPNRDNQYDVASSVVNTLPEQSTENTESASSKVALEEIKFVLTKSRGRPAMGRKTGLGYAMEIPPVMKFEEKPLLLQLTFILDGIIPRAAVSNVMNKEYKIGMKDVEKLTPTTLNDSITSEGIKWRRFSKLFEKDALEYLKRVINSKHRGGPWYCGKCSNELKQKSVECESCLRWFDWECELITVVPKGTWFCSTYCKQ